MSNKNFKFNLMVGLPVFLFIQMGLLYVGSHLFGVDFGEEVTLKGLFLLLFFFGTIPATTFGVIKIVELIAGTVGNNT